MGERESEREDCMNSLILMGEGCRGGERGRGKEDQLCVNACMYVCVLTYTDG